MQLRIRSLPLEGSKKLARAVKSRVPNLVCRACSERDFALMESPDEGFRTTLRRFDLGSDSDAYSTQQPLVTLICTNCGHLEQFAQAVLNGADPILYGKDHTSE